MSAKDEVQANTSALVDDATTTHTLPNGKATNETLPMHTPDEEEDPHILMIDSLRNQNNELFAQVRSAIQ